MKRIEVFLAVIIILRTDGRKSLRKRGYGESDAMLVKRRRGDEMEFLNNHAADFGRASAQIAEPA
jgi:hypothetical protein